MKKRLFKFILLFILGTVSVAYSQNNQIKGTVTDSEGIPIPGATVLVKGTTIGTSTDFDGTFNINASNEDVLLFSYVGYDNYETVIGEQKIINVTLIQSISELDATVIIGYGRVRKKDLTGSVSTISETDFNQGPVINAENLIQGRAPGVQISTQSAEPGGDVLIRIRGNNSINSNNSPLYVVDGFPMSSLDNSINPSNIKSINILKDASAAAIYGSRGANGVIIITTKRGIQGKSTISLETNSSFQFADIDAYDFLDSNEYANLQNRIWLDNGSVGLQPYSQAAIDRINQLGLNTNWMEEAFRTGRVQQHLLTIQSGNENTKFFLSGGMFKNDGAVKNTDFNRYTLRLNLDQNLLDGSLKLGMNTSLTNTITNFQGFTSSSLQDNILSGIFRADPIVPTDDIFEALSDADRQLIFRDARPVNPIETLFLSDNQSERFFILSNMFLEFQITQDLTFKTTGGARISNSKTQQFLPSSSSLTASSIPRGAAVISHYLDKYYIFENTLNYRKGFGKHDVNALLGLTNEWNRPESFSASATDFTTDALSYNSLQSGATPLTPTSSSISRELASLISRLNYTYDDKYLFTFTYRRDGSSALGINRQWGNFPAAAVAWKIHNEDFLNDSDVISTLKIRGSHGALGNARLAYGISQSAFSANGQVTTDGSNLSVGTIPSRVGNRDLKWERTIQTDIGLELGLINDKLFIELGAYKKNTKDLLLDKDVAPSLGVPGNSIIVNAGEIENKGLEFSISSKNISNLNFSWETNANLAYNKNEIKEIILPEGATLLPGDESKIHGTISGSHTVIKEGLPISSIYGYRFLGILQEGETAPDHQPNLQPGEAIFADLNGDGSFSADDREVLGNGYPTYTFGLTNSFRYKNFNLSVFISGALDVDKINGNNILGYTENTLNIANNRWSPSNTNGTLPQFGWNNDQWVNDLYVESTDYIRLKNISLSYNLDTEMIPWISRLQIYANAINLLTWTDYSGFDPEVNSTRSSNSNLNSSAGLDTFAYPNVKTISLGAKLEF